HVLILDNRGGKRAAAAACGFKAHFPPGAFSHGGGGMSHLAWLVPVALGMGLVGLAAFLWSMHSRQYEDLDGAAERVLLQEGQDMPLPGQRLGTDQTPYNDTKMDETQR